MSTLPQKPQLELNQGIEIEGAMDEEKTPSKRKTLNYEESQFESPEIIEYTGSNPQTNKEQVEQVEEPEKENPSEEVEDNLLELRKMMGMETKKEKEEANENPEPEVKEEADETVEEVVDEVKEEEPVKETRRREVAPSMEDMAKLAGQAAAEAIKQSNKESYEDIPNDVSSTLDEDDQSTYEVFAEMEKSNPDKYKGVKDKFANFVEASKEYQRQWSEENPDESFDPDSEEHADFYRDNEPKYSRSDFKKAEKKVDMAPLLSEVEKKYQERIDDLENKIHKKNESEPKARESASDAVKEMVKSVSPDLEKVMSEKGLEEAEKSDPLVFDKVSQAADTLSVMVYELEQNKTEIGLFSPNTKNQSHLAINEFLSNKEAYVKSLPLESQNWNGRRFATNSEFKRMSNAEKSRHWTIDANLAKAELVKEITATVNNQVEESRKMLERYGGAPAGKKTQSRSAGKTKTTNKPASPESSSTSASSPNLTTGTEEISTPEKELADMLWG
tara:strand:+ start:52402 stop:53910 length:1509 start_codon:yes stop_codon:yes gene_type:complete